MSNTLRERIDGCLTLRLYATTEADRTGYDAELQGLEAARDGFPLRPERFLGHEKLQDRYEQGYKDGLLLLKITRLLSTKEG